MTAKKILFVSSEASPFIKTGGLGDVAGSLPAALRRSGHDVRVVLPEYSQIPLKYRSRLEHLLHFRTSVVWRDEYIGVNRVAQQRVPFYFIDNKRHFYRDSLYDNEDRHVQFTLFIRGLLEMLPKINFQPDIIHCNDWQTAMLPVILKDNYQQYDFYSSIKTIFTIHNLRYQGIFGPEIIPDVLGVDFSYWHDGSIRHDGLVNFMKAGIMHADKITTVSQTYAEEIKTPEFGEGLDYALRMRGDDLVGIVNGISYQDFNPATDSELFASFDRENIAGKRENKTGLQRLLGLPVDPDKKIIALISRLVEQKGLDLVQYIAEDFLKSGLQFVVLGTGQPEYENFFRYLERRHPEQVAVEIKYDFELAKKIYAGSDFFLMPSRFEPCGLGQLISMRYGTIPIVRETGGLKDTVEQYTGEQGNGFTFQEYRGLALLEAIESAVEMARHPEKLEELQQRVMGLDFSWKSSARKYDRLYQALFKEETLRKKVPEEESRRVSEEDSRAGSKSGKEKFDLNRVTRRELLSIKGIGPSYADNILRYRRRQQGFKSREELKRVTGIGESRYARLKDYFFPC